MARRSVLIVHSFPISHLLLLLSSTFIFGTLEARPLDVLNPAGITEGFVDGLPLGSGTIKNSAAGGGSDNNNNNKKLFMMNIAHHQTLGGIKNSGPSPGIGHKSKKLKISGKLNYRVAGPSPGEGHKYTNAKTLGGNKVSGPSPGGGGHHKKLDKGLNKSQQN
ncbi:hypothetical protein BVC80_8963g19 [Macleaya cordata]|uniref:Uncharacterized protein n=1 Tax=Macleaya cordata TaxID=56857 RepID=A0A200PUZ9_MACCD|nr:hypothetical protein BVC80_8963g19 [Macleaya cordata]